MLFIIMVPSTVLKALDKLYHGKNWSFNGNDLSGLVWRDTTTQFDEAYFYQTYNSLLLNELRIERNKRIALTDYLFTSDFPHPSPEAKQAWLDYRQALRDLPANTADPENPVWPQAPN